MSNGDSHTNDAAMSQVTCCMCASYRHEKSDRHELSIQGVRHFATQESADSNIRLFKWESKNELQTNLYHHHVHVASHQSIVHRSLG